MNQVHYYIETPMAWADLRNDIRFQLDNVHGKNIGNFKDYVVGAHRCELIYYPCHLLDLAIFDDEYFSQTPMADLDKVEPALFYFKNNKWRMDEDICRFAGFPDLIIEIYSCCHSANQIKFNRKLYATSDITEYWEIFLGDTNVYCSIGETRLPKQNMHNQLQTQTGIKIDVSEWLANNETEFNNKYIIPTEWHNRDNEGKIYSFGLIGIY
ncbi:MAG: Uma2 family endonuclease [Defluviitaleaceae bacterium]|nr:Uma2 family endonuclease [Defluviitaleaceae bacterium]